LASGIVLSQQQLAQDVQIASQDALSGHGHEG
jgi:hypothetical protein